MTEPDVEFDLCVKQGLWSSFLACLHPVGLQLPGFRPYVSLAFGVEAVTSRTERHPDSPVTVRRGDPASGQSSLRPEVVVISLAFANIAGIHGIPNGHPEPFGMHSIIRVISVGAGRTGQLGLKVGNCRDRYSFLKSTNPAVGSPNSRRTSFSTNTFRLLSRSSSVPSVVRCVRIRLGQSRNG